MDAAATSRVIDHLPLVRAIAARLYRQRWGEAVGYDEYVQMGAGGLVEAASRYDATRGVPFGAFASWRITGAILDGLAQATEQHQQIAARQRLLGERRDSLTARNRTQDDASDEPLDRLLARIAEVAVGLAVGLMLEGTGLHRHPEESHVFDGAEHLAWRQLDAGLRHAVDSLPAQEAHVITEHYYRHRSFSEVATALGLTRGRVSQVHMSALQRLRESLRAHPAFDA